MSANDRDEEAPETHTVVVSSPNKPRPSDRLAIAVADTLRRVENNYHREGSGPGSRFEGELLEDVQARTAIAMVRAQQAEEAARAELEQPAPARPHWLVTDFDGYWEAQGYQRTGVEFDRDDLGDAFDAGAQAARDLAATAPARLEAADAMIRDVLESLCRRDGLPLESSVVPGEPARNYELADRLGIGRVFGLQPQSAAPAPGSRPEIRTCYCGTTATVVPGVFPHRDCDGSVRREPMPAPETPGRPTTSLEDAMLRNIDELSDLVRDMLEAFPDTADEQEWRDRAGRLDVHDTDGQPYRARTEDDL